MAFSDLASNQMVNETNAATGGFTAIGTKNAATQCYTKAQAQAAYALESAPMSTYATNQLVPKSTWVYRNLPPNPFELFANGGSSTVNAIRWTNTGDDVAVVNYKVYQNNIVIFTSGTGSSSTYASTGLTTGTPYTYKVEALDGAGLSTFSNELVMIPSAASGGTSSYQLYPRGGDNTCGSVTTLPTTVYSPTSTAGSVTQLYIDYAMLNKYNSTGLNTGIDYFLLVGATSKAVKQFTNTTGTVSNFATCP